MHPEVDPDDLYELDLNVLGLADVAKLGRYPSVVDLFANGRRQPVARWLDLKENILNMNDSGWTSCNGSKEQKIYSLPAAAIETLKIMLASIKKPVISMQNVSNVHIEGFTIEGSLDYGISMTQCS